MTVWKKSFKALQRRKSRHIFWQNVITHCPNQVQGCLHIAGVPQRDCVHHQAQSAELILDSFTVLLTNLAFDPMINRSSNPSSRPTPIQLRVDASALRFDSKVLELTEIKR